MKPTSTTRPPQPCGCLAPHPPGIYSDAYGHIARVKVGADPTPYRDQQRYRAGEATIAQMVGWQTRRRAELEAERAQATGAKVPAGTLEAARTEYLEERSLSKANRTRRAQQLAWWCAQPAALHAAPISVDALAADKTLATKPGRLGLVPRAKLDPKRLRQILADAFAPTDDDADPTEFATTSNHYRMALAHLFTILDQDAAGAVNPVRNVKTRRTRGAQPSGVDMRLVRLILQQLPSRFGHSGAISQARAGVLAWVHITPIQLARLVPARDFHDVPDASRADILDGAITLTVGARYKGRGKILAPPQTLPLNPWGVEAMRTFAATPGAAGPCSLPSLNKIVKRAAGEVQAALAKQKIVVDLSGFTLYHFKHSLTTAAQLASPGLLDRQGRIRPAPGVVAALSHRAPRTTRLYTEAAVDPLVRLANAQTTHYLEALFAQPLRAATALRLVAGTPEAD